MKAEMEEKRTGKGQELFQAGAMRIMEALGAVDEELLARCCGDGWQCQVQDGTGAEGSRKSAEGNRNGAEGSGRRAGKARKPLWQYGRAWAACIGLVAVGVVSWGALRLVMGPHGSVMQGGSGQSADEAVPMENDYGMDGMISGEGGEQGTAGGADLNGAAVSDKIEEEQEIQSGQEDGDRGKDSGSGQEGSIQDASGKETAGDRKQEEEGGGAGCDIAPAKDVYQDITEAQARSSVLGSYIPTRIPAGYGFESGSAHILSESGESDSMILTWQKGMDYITLVIGRAEKTDTVDVDKPETYDLRLYEIPYGESVPEAYRETVDHPVFAWEDMSLEIVESRMHRVADQGDTDTPRGNFEILYPDGVLVRFTGRGTAEEIWAMFSE